MNKSIFDLIKEVSIESVGNKLYDKIEKLVEYLSHRILEII